MSIKKKFIKGAIWNAISQFGSQVLNFIITIILARLLMPADFGIITQIMIFVLVLCYFTEFGLSTTLMQKKDLDEIDCNTAFWGIVFFSVGMYGIVFFTAPLLALFYDNEKIILITRIIFLQFLFTPFSLINESLEYKDLSFNKIAIAELFSILIAGVTSIILAYLKFAIWSLVVQSIISVLIRTFIIIFSTKWRPRLIFSFYRFKILFNMGKHFTYRNVIRYLSQNIDYLLIGKLAGSYALGIYNMAFRIANYPFTKAQFILGRMLFPAFNLISDDKSKIKINYHRLSSFGALMLVPFLITIYFGIDSFIILFLGQKWIDSTIIVKILTFYLILSCISFGDDPLMLTLHKIKLQNLIKTITSLLLLGIGFCAVNKYGVRGMAIAFAFLSILYTLIIKIVILKELNISLFEYLKNLKIILIYVLIYAFVLIIYSFIIVRLTNSNLIFLIGEGVIYISFMIVLVGKKGIFNIKTKKFNINAI